MPIIKVIEVIASSEKGIDDAGQWPFIEWMNKDNTNHPGINKRTKC